VQQQPIERLHPVVRQWVVDRGWESLRPIQNWAITALLESGAEQRDCVVSAPTAGGKTMAAMLPLVTRCVAKRGALEAAEPNGFEILYVSPLKALINQHSDRARDIGQLAAAVQTAEHPFGCSPWTGDVDDSRKKKIWENPSGVLLTTPESIEGRLLHDPNGLDRVLARVECIILDELHAYFDQPRGRHLISLLARLERRQDGRHIPRIALSATLGNSSERSAQSRDIERIAAFLRPGAGSFPMVVTEHGLITKTADGLQFPEVENGIEQHFILNLSVVPLGEPNTEADNQQHELAALEVSSGKGDAGPLAAMPVVSRGWHAAVAKRIEPLFTGFGMVVDGEAQPPLTALVFANSRHNVEELTKLLNEASPEIPLSSAWKAEQDKVNSSTDPRQKARADRFDKLSKYWPHHGSLPRAERHHAEYRMASGEIGCVLVCTTTLELGIDVGTIENVVQVGAGPSVSSLRQRLGRSRRLWQQGQLYDGGADGDPPKLDMFIVERLSNGARLGFLEELRLQIFQALAQLTLLRKSEYESPREGVLDLSTLVHQILCVLGECGGGGIKWGELRDLLAKSGPFEAAVKTPLYGETSDSIFDAVIRYLCDRRNGPALLKFDPIGPGGEDERRIYLDKTGIDELRKPNIYAAFVTAAEFTVRSATGKVASIDMSVPLTTGDFITLRGQGWEVIKVDRGAREVHVRPARGGRAPNFPGEGIPVSGIVAREMQRLYRLPQAELLDQARKTATIDELALQYLIEGQEAFVRVGLGRRGHNQPDVVERDGDVYIIPWRGQRHINAYLAILRACLIRATSVGPTIILPQTDIATLQKKLAHRWQAVSNLPHHELVRGFVSQANGKFDHHLSPVFWRHDFVSDKVSGNALVNAIRELQDLLRTKPRTPH
jgi:ATP-dependent helicase Lhr and Lhr-like helicase